jgi:hypothetical protein
MATSNIGPHRIASLICVANHLTLKNQSYKSHVVAITHFQKSHSNPAFEASAYCVASDDIEKAPALHMA